MDILILSLWDAWEYLPNKPAYAIRIYSSFMYSTERKPLQQSRFYKQIVEYIFDDVDEQSVGHSNSKLLKFSNISMAICYSSESRNFSINNEIRYNLKKIDDITAQKIVHDFAQRDDGIEVLLIHCLRGENRSPAVAIALNEIFHLGYSPEELKKRYNETNWYIYQKIKDAAKKLQL